MADEAKPQEISAAPAAEAALPFQSNEDRIIELEALLAEARENFLRAKAETDNTRRRAQTDIANTHKYAAENRSEEHTSELQSR